MGDKLANRLRATASDPFRFDEMLDHWNAAFKKSGDNPVTPDIEKAADQALIDIAAHDESDLIGPRLRQLIHTLPHAALVVSADGTITSMNEVAMRRTLVGPGDQVDTLPFLLENAEPISKVVRNVLEGRNSAGEPCLLRAIIGEDDRSGTFAVLPSLKHGVDPRALIFLIDPVWRTEVETMVARAFQLTSAESTILMAFLDGKSLADIAQSRQTSLVTVRTQFQRVMEKTGAHSQAELMRNTLAISTFFQDIAPVSDLAGHPHRKQFDIMRPGGRSLDVTLAGDMNGFPVLWLSTLSVHTLPVWYEAMLADCGILVIHMWRQGQGRSDPVPTGVDLAKTMADDLIAPLDHLGITRCPLVCFGGSLVDGLRMTHHTGDRITKILSCGTLLPSPLQSYKLQSVPWAVAMTRAAQSSSLLMRMIIIAGNKAWQAMGSRRFARVQFAASPPDLATIDLPGMISELDSAFLGSIAQGLDENCRTLGDSFGDWTEDLESACLPVEMIHGEDDPCAPLEDIRTIVHDLNPALTLIEVPDAGYMLAYRHPQVLIDRVKAAHTCIA